MSTVIENAQNYIRELFRNEFSGHDYSHSLRVFHTATRIAEEEKADLQLVQLATLLHDVDDRKLSPETSVHKDNAVNFLRSQKIAEEKIQRICQMIDEVSFKGTDSVVPTTLEGKCVQDADRLDAIGAIGIARAFAYGGNHNRVMYDPEILPELNMNDEKYAKHVSTTINHFYEKLFLLKDMMNTDSARRIAEERHKVMEDFVQQFKDEWEGLK